VCNNLSRFTTFTPASGKDKKLRAGTSLINIQGYGTVEIRATPATPGDRHCILELKDVAATGLCPIPSYKPCFIRPSLGQGDQMGHRQDGSYPKEQTSVQGNQKARAVSIGIQFTINKLQRNYGHRQHTQELLGSQTGQEGFN
jgi:hypothetical protein